MIRVHVEAARSTKNAAVRTLKQSEMCACPESTGQVFYVTDASLDCNYFLKGASDIVR